MNYKHTLNVVESHSVINSEQNNLDMKENIVYDSIYIKHKIGKIIYEVRDKNSSSPWGNDNGRGHGSLLGYWLCSVY